MKHQLGFYNDDPGKKVEFCKVCGVENPSGDCPGRYIDPKKNVNNGTAIDREKEQD